jgi:hypothetical protein
MALSYSQISAITRKKFIPKLRDNIYEANPLLQRLKRSSSSLDGGTSIMLPLEYSTVTAAGWYQGSDTLDTADNETVTAAEYQWKQSYANISISRLDELKNSGDSQVLDHVKGKVKSAEKTMADNISTALYNDGTTAKALVGLRAILSTSNTVGGIDQSSYSWWQSNVDSSTTTTSMSAMQTQFNAASVGNDAPTVCMVTRALLNSYYALLQPQQRFTDSQTAKGGFQNLMFNGIPVIVDAHQAASHMMFLNEKYLDLFIHKDENFRFEDFVKPTNQNVRVGKVYFAGALGSSNNRMHALLSALTA